MTDGQDKQGSCGSMEEISTWGMDSVLPSLQVQRRCRLWEGNTLEIFETELQRAVFGNKTAAECQPGSDWAFSL